MAYIGCYLESFHYHITTIFELEMKELYKALGKVKSEVGAISKEETNPFFKSKYFDINGLLKHVEPLLEKNGLLLLQPIHEGNVYSQIIHIETGDKIESSMNMQELTDPQKMGSMITYYRRYTLQSLLGLQAEDDDGNSASQAKPKDNIPVVWLTETQAEKAIQDGKVKQALDYYDSTTVRDGKKYCMSKVLKTKLQAEV